MMPMAFSRIPGPAPARPGISEPAIPDHRGETRLKMEQRYIFKELTEVATFLIERSSLPELPRAVREKSSFNI